MIVFQTVEHSLISCWSIISVKYRYADSRLKFISSLCLSNVTVTTETLSYRVFQCHIWGNGGRREYSHIYQNRVTITWCPHLICFTSLMTLQKSYLACWHFAKEKAFLNFLQMDCLHTTLCDKKKQRRQ